MGAACFTAWADGYTRGEIVTDKNTLVDGKKYIVFCSNSETPAKSGYWTTNSTGTNLIMAQHDEDADAEFDDSFVWQIEKKIETDGIYWVFTNLATHTKILQASSSTDYCAALMGNTIAAKYSLGNAGKTGTWKFNHYPSFYTGYRSTDLYTPTDGNYGVNESEGIALAYKTAGSGAAQCYMMIYSAEQPITNPYQIKLNELITQVQNDRKDPTDLKDELDRARAVQDATLEDVEALFAPYLIYKGQNTATLQKPEATEPDAYGSVYMPFSMVVPEGVSAYAAVAEGDELKLTKVGVGGNTIPAGAYILWSSSVCGEVTMAKAATEAPDLQVTNELTGTIVDDIALPEGSNYVLSKGTQGVGFYKYTPTTYPAKRAVYSAGTAGSTSRFIFSFDDVVTALPLLPATIDATSVSYDLQGRKQSAPRSGISIKGGRKNIIR